MPTVVRLSVVELADDRLDVEPDHVVGQDLGQKRQDRAEPLKLDRHDGRSAGYRRALRDGEREHPADQEPGGLAVERDQVGLGEDLRQVVGAQGVDKEREMSGVEHAEERRVRRPGVAVPVPPKVPWIGLTKPSGPSAWV